MNEKINLNVYQYFNKFLIQFAFENGELDLTESAKMGLAEILKKYANFEVTDKTVKWAVEKLIETVWENPDWGDLWDAELLRRTETKDGSVLSYGIGIGDLVFKAK